MEVTNEAKNAILNVFANAAWSVPNGQQYYDALADAFFGVASISAVYTQSGTVYDTDTLDDLKADLVVTATLKDSTTETVPSTDYTLSGTLSAGTSTITVSYGGKSTTFNVTVSGYLPAGYTKYDYLIKTAGKQDAVNTGLFHSPSFAVLDMDFEFEVTGTETAGSQQGMGLREATATKTDNFALFFGQGTDAWAFRSQVLGSGSQTDVGQFTPNVVRHASYRYNNGAPYFAIDGGEPVNMVNPPSSIDTNNTYPLWLCGLNNGHNNVTYSDASSGRVRWGKVTFKNANGDAVYEFVPASNGTKSGYFERINGVFYPSINSFISGGNY